MGGFSIHLGKWVNQKGETFERWSPLERRAFGLKVRDINNSLEDIRLEMAELVSNQ